MWQSGSLAVWQCGSGAPSPSNLPPEGSQKHDDNDGCNDNYDDNFGNFDDDYDKND